MGDDDHGGAGQVARDLLEAPDPARRDDVAVLEAGVRVVLPQSGCLVERHALGIAVVPLTQVVIAAGHLDAEPVGDDPTRLGRPRQRRGDDAVPHATLEAGAGLGRLPASHVVEGDVGRPLQLHLCVPVRLAVARESDDRSGQVEGRRH